MNHQLRGTGISLLLHVTILGSFLYLGSLLPATSPPMIIDFSLEKSCTACPSCNCSPKTETAIPAPKPPVKLKEENPPDPPPQELVQPLKTTPVEQPQQKPKEKVVEDVVKNPVIKPAKKPVIEKIARNKSKKRLAVARKPLPVTPEVKKKTVTIEKVAEEKRESKRVPYHKVVLQKVIQPSNTPPAPAVNPTPRLKSREGDSGPRQHYLSLNAAAIRDTLIHNINYPSIARRMGWEGRVMVSFTIRSDGNPEDIRVTKSCGFPALDRNAIKTVARSGPFPTPPTRLVKITLPILYHLD